MKSYILIAFLLICSCNVFSQLSINLIVSSRPPANLSEWPLKKESVILIVTNLQEAKHVKIRASLKTSDGTEVASTDMNLAQTVLIPRGNTVYNAGVVFPLEAQRFSGRFDNTLKRTGKLPSDSYQLCVELDSATNLAPLTPSVCRPFFVAGMQLPVLMKPYNGEVLDPVKSQTAIMFRWTPLSPAPQSIVNYRIRVFEILDNQQPVQALRSNQPLLDRTIGMQTQFIWQPQLGLVNADRDSIGSSTAQSNRFIWTIQTLDASMNPISSEGNYEGLSEPLQFSISDKNKKPGSIKN